MRRYIHNNPKSKKNSDEKGVIFNPIRRNPN